MSTRNWNRTAHRGKRTLSTADENEHRGKDAAARWLENNDRQGPPKEQMRREADRLVDACKGPITHVPAGMSGCVSIERSKMSAAGGQTGRFVNTGKARNSTRISNGSKGLRGDSLGRRASADRPQIDRTVPTGLVIYCDGACEPNPGIGGWGFVVYRDGVEIHADCGGANPTTNNIMEMTGALMALRWLADRTYGEVYGAGAEPGAEPRLFCDSQYVVNGCNDWRHNWKARGWKRKGKNPEIANLELWQQLDAALTLALIKLEWCKGHAGIIGNERADELSLIGRERASKDSLALKRCASEGDHAREMTESDHRLAQIRMQLDYRE